MKWKKSKGQIGEDMALSYLRAQGYGLICRNWRKRVGEIDLVVFDNYSRELVFVEVKLRCTEKFGGITETITPNKKVKLINIINNYIIDTGYRGNYRLDFIGIDPTSRIIHLINADLN